MPVNRPSSRLGLPLTCLAVLLAVTCAPRGATAQSFDYEDALEKAIWFFDANKCGPNVAADNVFAWRGACHVQDGNTASPARDLTGGFHDAGDHVKFGLPQGFAASVLGWSLYEYRDEFDDAGVTAKTLRTLKYFTDYFLRSHPNATTFYYHVGDGGADHGYWGTPEAQTGTRPLFVATPTSLAADILGQHAGALALMSLNYRSTDAAYANQCLTAARELYALGRTQLAAAGCTTTACRGLDGGDFYNSSSHFDDMAWGAIWLSIATGDATFLDPVDDWLSRPNDPGDNPYQKRWTMAWDDMTLGNFILMHELTGRQKYADGLRWNLDWYANTLQKTPAGLPWLDQWGVLRYASAEAGLGFLAYKKFGYADFFTRGNFVVNYILGTNPRGGSYITNYLTNPPIHPHHRANEPVRGGPTRGMVGALVGGPANNDTWVDSVDDFRANEVALDYNASLVFALAGRIYFANGGQPGTPPPPPPPPPMSPPSNGTGLTGNYYNGIALGGTPLLTRVDPTVNFNFAGGPAAPGLPADQFSVRWEGQVEARSDEVYTFYVTHDDGARLWVNDQLVINNWTDHAAIEDSGSITLGLGQRYSIRLEFYESGGDAVATLSWSTPLGLAKQIIPQSQLFPAGGQPVPNFTLSASPASLNVVRGTSGTSTVSIARTGGFTGSVDLSVSGLPTGVTAGFSVDPTTGNSSVLTLTASATATLGNATVTISGVGTPGTRSTTLALTVSPQVTPNFSLSASPATLNVVRGTSGTSTIAITRTGGFTASVDLSASGLPTGVTAGFSADPTTGNSSVLTLTASATATLGNATVTISGVGTPGTRSTTLALTVSPQVTQDFSLSASPATLTVNRGASGTSTIAIARTGGFTGSVDLSATGLPTGVTAGFSADPTTGNSSVLTLTASATATLGNATVTISGAGTPGTRSTTVALTVAQGPTGTGGVTVTPSFSGSPWFNESKVTLGNTGALTAMTLTVVVQRTTGVSHNGAYQTVGPQIVQDPPVVTTATLTYVWRLAAGQTLSAGSGRLFVAQTGGTGTVHPSAGDTWTVTYTTGGTVFTQSGTF
jgi:endoglucanase